MGVVLWESKKDVTFASRIINRRLVFMSYKYDK